MTFAKMDAIIRRNADKEQHTITPNLVQTRLYNHLKQDTTFEPETHAVSSVSIPSLDLFDTGNPVCDPAEEEFRKQMLKKKKKRGPKL